MEPLRQDDPAFVGDYKITARLGAGGMGQVYLGASPGGRPVAVKTIRWEHAADPRFRQRFAAEVAAARRVSGFYTAQLLDADPAASPPWMVTAYVDGPSLDTLVKERGPLSSREVRRLGAGLAEGLRAIHAAGLVHRDLKPGNIIVSSDGPRIIDFGIARALDAATMTATGMMLGTVPYMSPEQLGLDEIGPASDVFSLGGVLVFASTGKAPFDAPSVGAMVMRIATSQPDLAGVPADLLDHLTRCLAKDPAARPAPAELTTLLTAPSGRPPLTLPLSSPDWSTAPRAEQVSRVAPVVPASGPHASPPFPAGRRPAGISRRGLLGGAAVLAGAAAAAAGGGFFLLRDGGDGERLPGFDNGDLRAVAFSPDSKLLAAGGTRLKGGDEEYLVVWEVATKRKKAAESIRSGVWDVAFSPDGKIIAAGCDDGTVRLVDPVTLKELGTLSGHSERCESISWSADGVLATTSRGDKTVRLWDVAARRELRRIKHGFGNPSSVSFAKTKPLLAICGTDAPVEVWDTAADKRVHRLDKVSAFRVGLARGGDLLLTVGPAATQVWSLGPPLSDAPRFTPAGITSIYPAAFSATEDMVAFGGRIDGRPAIRVCNSYSGNVEYEFHPAKDLVAVTFSPDGRYLAGGGYRDHRLWTL
ncbi:WD40 repeat domain-containing serine/threonine protein kinase [Actinomadura macrotermitis]|uniref:Serine/threonine-protein kinase PknD n=1 Tax=Actinomadura macrotermitis TaxID=2585200 RepID=A0A7K0BW71_9ACTN|nr:serine/threonine-protein kinase [Actinomadura macrotermitis]MQY05433.1 Serine/threonine-protein kinase PknD [Actinomadura macrotermitis]